MAFGVKYRLQFRDFQNDRLSKVDILEDGYGGGVTTLTGAKSPFKINYNEERWVIGSEAVLNIIADQSDVSTFDADFLESAYKNKKLKFYADGTNLTWVGYLKPENAEREYHSYKPVYNLSATDAIGDLKDIKYTNAGAVYEDTVSILTTIKRVIDLTGIDDNKFFTQINTYEKNLMTATGGETTQDPLAEVDIDNRRFFSVEDGEVVPMNGYDVLVNAVKIFNCRFFQQDGYWRIVNDQEYNSFRWTYNYDLTSENTRAANDRSLDVNTYSPFQSVWGLSKNAPLKKQRVKFLNKNLGDNELTANPGFETGGNPPPNWTNSGWDSFITTTVDGNKVGETTETTTNTDEKYIESESFVLSSVDPDNDVLIVRFKIILKSVTFTTTEKHPLIFAAIHDGSNETRAGGRQLTTVDGDFATFEFTIPLTTSGTYTVRLYVKPLDSTDQLTYYWDDVEVINQATANTTTDTIYVFENSSEGYDIEEEEVLFGDSLQQSDIGKLSVAGTLTTTWERFNRSESVSLVNTIGRQLLNGRQAYQERIHIDILDTSDTIGFGTVLEYQSRFYAFETFSKVYDDNKVSGDIVEINNSDATLTSTVQPLTSVDGESTGTTQTLVGTGTLLQTLQQVLDTGNISTTGFTLTQATLTFKYDASNFNDITVDSTGKISFSDDVDIVGQLTENGTNVSLEGHTHALPDLSDVANFDMGTISPSPGLPPDKDNSAGGGAEAFYVLGHNETNWTALPINLGYIDDIGYDHGDAVTDGHVLKYDSGTGQWNPEAESAGPHNLGASEHSDIANFAGTETDGDYLHYVGGGTNNWTIITKAGAQSDLNYWTLTGGDLRYAGTAALDKLEFFSVASGETFLEIGDGGIGNVVYSMERRSGNDIALKAEYGTLSLWAGASGVPSKVMTLFNTGEVGLGADKSFEFVSGGAVRFIDSGGINIGTDDDVKITWDNTNVEMNINMVSEGNLVFQDDGTDKFTFDLAGTDTGIATALDWVATSDEKWKENIAGFVAPANEVEMLRGLLRRFVWKDTGREDIGMIAQEVQNVAPELSRYLVKQNKDGLSLNYIKLALLLAI